MTRIDKLLKEFRQCRADFPYRDLVTLLEALGYREKETSGGSRRRFVNAVSMHIIRLHQPHPGPNVKAYMVKEIRQQLADRGLI